MVKKSSSGLKDWWHVDPFLELIEFSDLKRKIPPRLFERSTASGLFHLVCSLFWSAFAAYVWWYLCQGASWTPWAWMPWQLSWTLLPVDCLCIWIVGTVYTSLWSFAHECGHGGTTPHTWLNDLIGFTLHTALLVPYFPWQQSHAQHHARNQHISQGETHRPDLTKEWNKKPVSLQPGRKRYWTKRKILHPLGIVLGLALGWRLYLLFGLTGAVERPDGKKIKSHTHHAPSDFFPNGYPKWKILVSNVALLVPLYGWYWFYQTFGAALFIRQVLGPQLVVDVYLNAITKAQHSHPKTTWLGPKAWTWYKGAIQTVDHSYGPVVDWLHHYIGPSHVSHHLFPTAPAHNGPEITKILKRELKDFYIVAKKGPWETIFANSYRRVKEKPDEYGVYSWLGIHHPDEF